MMDGSQWLRFAACAAVTCAASQGAARPAEASLSVVSWRLDCALSDAAGHLSNAVFRTVETPFVNQHQVQLGLATDSASYNIVFDSQMFDFDVTASVTAPGSPPIY